MGIGNLVGVVTGLINPIVGVVGKAAQVGFQVIDKKVNKQPLHPAREHAFQMLCDLQKDIIKKSPVKTLLHL